MAFNRKKIKKKEKKKELLRPFYTIPYLAINMEIKQDFDVHCGAFAMPGIYNSWLKPKLISV